MNAVQSLSRDEIFDEIRRELVDLFELQPSQVELGTKLYDDLDLDSIDAVDLVVRLQEVTKKRIRPEQFKAIRTVGDIVDAVEQILTQ